MKKFFTAIFVIVIAGFTGISLYFYFTQEDHIFAFPSLPHHYKYELALPHHHIHLKTENGGDIHGILYEAKGENSRGVIYFFHGKGSNLSHPKWQKVVDRYTALGFDFFMIDYRGAGLSRGAMIEEHMLADCLSGYRYLLDNYPEDKITVYGKSLGTSFATFVAANTSPRALILEAPFYNLHDIACTTVPALPSFIVSLILKYRLTTDVWIQNVKCPIYVFHGTADTIVPIDASLRFKTLLEGKTHLDLTIIEEGDHDHLYQHSIFNDKIEEALGLTPRESEKISIKSTDQ